MGRFLVGSTIVILFKQGGIACNKEWVPNGLFRSAKRWETAGLEAR